MTRCFIELLTVNAARPAKAPSLTRFLGDTRGSSVAYWVNSGKHLLAASISHFDPNRKCSSGPI
jgi:hypothetical protein